MSALSMTGPMKDLKILARPQWQALRTEHESRADALTSAHRARRQRQEKHPIYDFLFEYYPIRPAHLRRWHPGLGVGLEGEAPHLAWRDYQLIDAPSPTTTLDLPALWDRRAEAFRYIRDLLHRTESRPAHFDCFGLHEWAMVYRTGATRHDLPLRLGQARTDEVVENSRLRCTHFDAYRFFTEPARPLNLTVLNRSTQHEFEQSGCVHATMDLYKWAGKLGPLIPSELLLDTFELAIDARVLDMEASPYDCQGHGFGVVAIETSEGKAEYIDRQRRLTQRAEPLRRRLVALIEEAETARLAV